MHTPSTGYATPEEVPEASAAPAGPEPPGVPEVALRERTHDREGLAPAGAALAGPAAAAPIPAGPSLASASISASVSASVSTTARRWSASSGSWATLNADWYGPGGWSAPGGGHRAKELGGAGLPVEGQRVVAAGAKHAVEAGGVGADGGGVGDAREEALGMALDDVLERLMAGVVGEGGGEAETIDPAAIVGGEGGGAPGGERGQRCEVQQDNQGGRGGARQQVQSTSPEPRELDDRRMDIDSPHTDFASSSPTHDEGGPGPSTAAFRDALARKGNERDDVDGDGGSGGPDSEADDDDDADADEGEEEEPEQEQLDEVLEDDQQFYDVLVHDLRECINEPEWTFDLWRGVFTDEYGWDPDPLLDKYGALVEAALPAFTAKLDKEGGREEGKEEEGVGKADEGQGKNIGHVSNQYRLVLHELKAWDWDSPASTLKHFYEVFTRKHGFSPVSVFYANRAHFKQIIPGLAARLKANRGSSRANGEADVRVDEIGVGLRHRDMFDWVVEELRAQDFTKPFTQSRWLANLATILSAADAARVRSIVSVYAAQLRRMVPEYAQRMDLNRAGQYGVDTASAILARAPAHSSAGHAGPRQGSQVAKYAGPPPSQRSPRTARRGTHGRATTVAERQARARLLDAAVRQVSAMYQDVFIILVDQMNDFDWTCEGDAMAKFRLHCLRRRLSSTHINRVIGHYGSLLRRCCPDFAARMEEDRRTGGNNTPRERRANGKTRAPSADSDFQILSRFPSPNASPPPRALASLERELERTPRPRPAPYIRPTRLAGPLSFPSALAELDVEVYRHQSGSALLPQLPSFVDFLSSDARAKYDTLVARVRTLEPAIEDRLTDLRALAKEVDGLQGAVRADWAALQATSTGESAATAMDIDGDPPRLQAWEDKQAAVVARRNVLHGRRADLERLRDERARCLARVRRIDEVVVAARAKIEAALMDEEE